jgi:MoaA/NifB/PqqE/SkfB family radical SAM enzyme
MDGRLLDAYSAPLFLAWQLTNECTGACLACCEESGVGHKWADELSAEEALRITQEIIDLGIPYVAFGGGEPLSVPHAWDIFERLSAARIAIKLETNGVLIDDAAAKRLDELGIDCIQISIDAATPATQEKMRPGMNFAESLAMVDRLVAVGRAPQWVFVPSRLNLHEIQAAYDLAVAHGCAAFVTGPLMRLGRAAAAWPLLAPEPEDWDKAAASLRVHAAALGNPITLSIYPWDILCELQTRLDSPQAMVLVVPNGRVKLLNALPFAPGDLRVMSLAQAWDAYRAGWRAPRVADFIARCARTPSWLLHANECWDMPEVHVPGELAA